MRHGPQHGCGSAGAGHFWVPKALAPSKCPLLHITWIRSLSLCQDEAMVFADQDVDCSPLWPGGTPLQDGHQRSGTEGTRSQTKTP